MTFDEASQLVLKSNVIGLEKELGNGLGPNLSNQYGLH